MSILNEIAQGFNAGYSTGYSSGAYGVNTVSGFLGNFSTPQTTTTYQEIPAYNQDQNYMQSNDTIGIMLGFVAIGVLFLIAKEQ